MAAHSSSSHVSDVNVIIVPQAVVMVLESKGDTASHMMMKLLQSFWKTGLITVDQMNRVSAFSAELSFKISFSLFEIHDLNKVSIFYENECSHTVHFLLLYPCRASSVSTMSSLKSTLTCHMPTPSWRPLWTSASRSLSSPNSWGMPVPPGSLAID